MVFALLVFLCTPFTFMAELELGLMEVRRSTAEFGGGEVPRWCVPEGGWGNGGWGEIQVRRLLNMDR